MSERPDLTGSSAADPTRPVTPAVDPASRPPEDPTSRLPVDPAPRPPADPLADRTTAVHPLPERPRDDTLPNNPAAPSAEQGPPTRTTDRTPERTAERTTWHPEDDPRDRQTGETRPEWSTGPVAVRRADSFAAFLLLLAGIAAGVSLLVPWTPGGPTGLDLVGQGIDQLGSDWTAVFSTGLWRPLVVVFGGAVLFVLGLLLLIPAKAHRFLGVLALLVALAVVAAVLVPLADAAWDLGTFDLGFFFAIAVAGLGLLGALKAALTGTKHR